MIQFQRWPIAFEAMQVTELNPTWMIFSFSDVIIVTCKVPLMLNYWTIEAPLGGVDSKKKKKRKRTRKIHCELYSSELDEVSIETWNEEWQKHP